MLTNTPASRWSISYASEHSSVVATLIAHPTALTLLAKAAATDRTNHVLPAFRTFGMVLTCMQGPQMEANAVVAFHLQLSL
jgi:hypothetical protein